MKGMVFKQLSLYFTVEIDDDLTGSEPKSKMKKNH